MISIILPIAQHESKKKIKRCLDSLADLTTKNFEVIIITPTSVFKTFSSFFKNYPFINKILTGEWNKSEARNNGARKAKGQYILNLDVDMQLVPKLLAELTHRAQKGQLAIIPPLEVAKGVNFWGQCRALERKLTDQSPILRTPLFVKKSLLKKVGGYKPMFDPLDDWGLHLALKREKVKFYRCKNKISLWVSPTLKNSFQRMYQRGQALPNLKQQYPQMKQIKISNKFKLYKKQWPLLFRSPGHSMGLFILKLIDLVAFWWGTKHPRYPYQLTKTAITYDQKRLGTTFTRYKHFVELSSIIKLLGSTKGRILELGCGTGRTTAELVKKGFSVTAVDPSQAMLRQFRQKKGLPKPILLKNKRLPFADNQFEHVISLRVIWHILEKKERELFFSEAVRVAKTNVIMDFSIKNMGLNFLFKNGWQVNKKELKKITKNNKLVIEETKKLPLGRLLIRFKKC
ncbi:methyltransferase domain-containing protein [Patescibacteria group bacterium]